MQALNAAGRIADEAVRVERINQIANRARYMTDAQLWQSEDYWATPVEFAALAAGDCEDYSLAKYFALRELGMPADKLRITYVRLLREGRLVEPFQQRIEASDEAPVAPPSGPTPGADRDAWVAFLAALPPDAVPDADDPAAVPPVVLARLSGVQFDRVDGQWQATVETVDMSVRPLLLSTATLQRVLMPALATPPLVGGPVMVAAGSAAVGATVTLVFSQPLAAASVAVQAFTVTQFDAATGWRSLTVDAATYTEPAGVPTVTLALNGARDDTLAVRVTAQGRGPTPLMGASGLPLGAPEPQADGQQLSITLS